MKKGNEGYVLVFVMVVLIVLCISSVTLMSTSLSNLQKQQENLNKKGYYIEVTQEAPKGAEGVE